MTGRVGVIQLISISQIGGHGNERKENEAEVSMGVAQKGSVDIYQVGVPALGQFAA